MKQRTRWAFITSGLLAFVGIGEFISVLIWGVSAIRLGLGFLYLLVAVGCLVSALQLRRRAVPPVLREPTPEVVALVQQGRKIQAIRRYRKLNPDTSLQDAKDVIDGI